MGLFHLAKLIREAALQLPVLLFAHILLQRVDIFHTMTVLSLFRCCA